MFFSGHRDHRLDPKDRLVIPSHFAAAIQAEREGWVVLVPQAEGDCLELYPLRVYEAAANAQVPDHFAANQDGRRLFFQEAEQVQLKGPGRVTLPKRFVEEFFPNGRVRVAGMHTYLELWDPERWDARVGTARRRGGAATDGARSR